MSEKDKNKEREQAKDKYKSFSFLSLWIYHDHHKQAYFQNLSSVTLQFFPIS